MMIGETHRHLNLRVPPWQDQHINHPTAQISSSSLLTPSSPPSNLPTTPQSPSYADVLAYLIAAGAGDGDSSAESDFPAGDDDEFYMYEFKVRKCTRARAHDWTECPFAHPGEKARRRDPRKYSYSGTACSDFRKGSCKKGDSCEFAHGVFECWLHPSRYRTQACKDGPGCKRRVCFFAHSPDQLRVGSGLGSPVSQKSAGSEFFDDGLFGSGSVSSIGDLVASLRNLQLSKVKSQPTSGPNWSVGIGSPLFGSPRGTGSPVARPGFFSLPTTPTRPGIRYLDAWDTNRKDQFGDYQEEEPVLERVESGRELRVRMFEKLSKENSLHGPGLVEASGSGPDFGWVSDLIK
ncbi:hypothetical protein Cgig2_004224 [Carnegiea gigantea]|uniref:C3H1-type domain-containing protein n=1 Tax=Carnegiea gigantea TaxID=171969 RepID=A0A9Q1JWH5_9CARY|nr:hypothetical protein Cgig2_014983 [Carnegiea gigantea]KAJ8435967.1 hypothetical protein Cgig2_004224 [Carnegiea gigantea]